MKYYHPTAQGPLKSLSEQPLSQILCTHISYKCKMPVTLLLVSHYLRVHLGPLRVDNLRKELSP